MNKHYEYRDKRLPIDPIKDQFAANDSIRAANVRLIDSLGENKGVMSTREALLMAQTQSLDLVLITPNVSPPVAKICDYSKFIYSQKQAKKEQDKKNRENAIVIKEIQLRPNIGSHDVDIKLNHAKEWLQEKYKVKITLKLRGRELAFAGKGFEVVQNFIKQVPNCKVEKEPEMSAKMITAMIVPDLKRDK